MLTRYVARRLLQAAITLVGVSILIFVIARLLPGDPARVALGDAATNEQVAQLRRQLRLDDPIPVQYVAYMAGVLRGDLGNSLYTNGAVGRDLLDRLPATAELVLVSTLLMIGIGIPLGTLAGRNRDGPIDNFTRLFSLLGVVTPSFVWAIFLLLVFAYWLEILPVAGRLSESVAPPPTVTGLHLVDTLLAGDLAAFRDTLAHIVMPAIALSLASIGQTARMTRANVGESFDRAYVEFARAYGFSPWRIAAKYALRPALIPTVTILGLDIAVKLGSAFLVETVFAWPGMARYGIQVILHKDLNAIVATVMVISLTFVLVNLVVDVIVALIDPRIRLGMRAS